MQEQECFADSSDNLCDFTEKDLLEDSHKALDLEQKGFIISAKVQKDT